MPQGINIKSQMKSYNPPGSTEDFDIEQVVIHGTQINLFNVSATRGTLTLASPKALYLENTGKVPVSIIFEMYGYDSATNQDSTQTRVQMVLDPGEWYYLSNARMFECEAVTSYLGTEKDNQAPDANMYEDSGIDIDATTVTDNVVGSASNTTVYLEQYTSAAVNATNGFAVGDLIRIRDEIMEVTAIGSGVDLANTTLTVKRGMFGSTATSSIADDDPVRLPFFNMHHDFDTYTTAQTNSDGRYHAKNLYGFGRGSQTIIDKGIVPGSYAMKFYNPGYQELGLSGTTSTSTSGLSVSTQYYFKIRIDGSGSGATELNFTTDATNVRWGGATGIIAKMQKAIDDEFYDSSSDLYKKSATIEIVEGDIRVTSGQRLSTSAISLEAGTSGGSAAVRIFAQLNGVIPAAADLLAAIPAALPDDTITDPITNEAKKNDTVFARDDGHGNIVGAGCTGSLNYETGEIRFKGPKNAHWVFSVAHNAAAGGQVSASGENLLKTIIARSINQKIDSKVYLKIWN